VAVAAVPCRMAGRWSCARTRGRPTFGPAGELYVRPVSTGVFRGIMKAAWYERQGPAASVLVVGEMTTPEPGLGEGRIRVAASGINPGDVKKRQDAFRVGIAFPRVVTQSAGAAR